MRLLGIALLMALGFGITTPAWAEEDDAQNSVESTEQEIDAQRQEEQSDEAPNESAAETKPESKESLTFAGETLELAWQGSNQGESVREFIPEGEELESWTKLASIREYDELNDVPALVGAFVRVLKERYPRSTAQIFENDETGASMIEFTVWPGDGEMLDAPFVEYNIFKYEKRPEGGAVAQQYALRAYSDTEEFLKKLEPNKKRLLDEMGDKGLQVDSDEEESGDADE